MILKELDKSYIQDMVRLYLSAYEGLEEYSYDHPSDAEDYINWLFARDSEGIIGAFENKELVGFICIDKHWYSKRERKTLGAIHELVVAKAYRRKGIATKLVNRALELFKENGLDSIELWAGVNNLAAIKLYEKLGFEARERYGKWVRMVSNLSLGELRGELLKNTAP